MKATTRNSLYALSLLPSLLVIVGNLSGGPFSFLNLVFSLGLLGALEWVTTPSLSNEHGSKEDLLPKLVLWLHIPAQLICLVSFFYGIYSNILQGYWIAGAAISMGVNSGSAAIVVSHELIHHKNKLQQFLGKWLLFTAGNFYFFVEHLRVHHKWVGTQHDPASARKGQSLYAFFVSSGIGQIKGAWKLENERVRKEGKSWFSHYVKRQLFLHLLFDTIIVITFGWAAILAFILHCIIANFLLEYVNYIEHYGLVRNEKERVTEIHSWQSDKWISRFVLIDLSRHADHHYYASKPFHMLSTYTKSPVLPSGYAGLFFVAAIPALWFNIIDKKLDEYKLE